MTTAATLSAKLTAERTAKGENGLPVFGIPTLDGEKINENATIALKEGDRISVTAKNTNQTISQTLKNFFYQIAGNDTYQIAAQHAGIVTATGTSRY